MVVVLQHSGDGRKPPDAAAPLLGVGGRQVHVVPRGGATSTAVLEQRLLVVLRVVVFVPLLLAVVHVVGEEAGAQLPGHNGAS